ncbi:MAG: hypothetical protein H0T96_03265, partial [Thermoleophilaceae bacterium]|nr:hypothetical protein [Thermoleophilaceae bacterium]
SSAIDKRDRPRAGTAAIDVAQSALDLELRYRPPAEIDLGRFDRIKDLDRPGGDAGKQAEQFTAAFERFLKQDYRPGVEKLQKAVGNRDRQAIRSAALGLRSINTQDVNRLAGQVGVSKCASGG